MARKKTGGGGGGAPEWLVTFADLMSLLVCFFVLIISFSNQDEKKLQIVAGSMKEAFGATTEVRRAGFIERDGVPENEHFRSTTVQPKEGQTDYSNESNPDKTAQGQEANTFDLAKAETETPRRFLAAALTIRQALQDMPDFAEVSKSIHLRADEDGLHIEFTDQDGRAMFAQGSDQLYSHAERLFARVAPALRELPNRMTITGHTTVARGVATADYSHWELSADRALAVRRYLVRSGLPPGRIEAVVGKGDSEPLFENDPGLTANRRVTILLMDEPPPIPFDHQL